MGSVSINLSNGQLGAVLQTNDGITGLITTGTTEGAYTVGDTILITGLADFMGHGITIAGNAFAYKQVKEFYDEAGAGSKLYLMLVPVTMKVNQIADKTNANGAEKLLLFANGQIKVLGILTDDNAVYLGGSPVVITNGLNADVSTAVTNMAALALDRFQAQQPFRCIIGGTSYTGVATALTDVTSGTSNNRTSVLIGDSVSGEAVCMGLLLGRIAVIPVQRKISRVRTGALTNQSAYVGVLSATAIGANLSVIASKGYITFITYPNISGYYFSGDDTCSSVDDDYHFLARGRVIDKAHLLTYATFVQEIDDEVLVNTDGTLDAGFCKWLGRQIENQINNTMTANKEISNVACYIDPMQNIISTSQLNIVLKITPVGYASDIEIILGFTNPLV